MTEWQWLALAAALVTGWWVGRKSANNSSVSSSSGLSSGYVEGLNYLLNEQPDRAIDVLVSMVEVDSETVATHLALGTLFRNQGEVDRAIRIHQNLIARPTLSKLQRLQALMNLGLDYKQAGLNDRAVVLFEQLSQEAPPHRDQALENLLDIYQYEQEWLKAIRVSRKLLERGSASQRQLIGHFYAELAERAIANNDLRGAAKMLRQMRSVSPRLPRYLLLQLKVARLRGKNRAALRWVEEIIAHCPEYRQQIMDDLEACFLGMGADERFQQRLQELAADSRSGARLLCQIAAIVQRRQGDSAALSLLLEQSGRLSSPMLTATILRLGDLKSERVSGEQLTVLVKELETGALAAGAAYRCHHCGFEAKESHWRCPGCGVWDGLEFQELI